METAVTYLCDAVMATGFVYFSVAFVLGLIDRWNQTDPTVTAIVKAREVRPALPEPMARPLAIPQREREMVAIESNAD